MKTIFCALVIFAMVGCDDARRQGPAEQAGSEIDRGLNEAGRQMDRAGEQAGGAMNQQPQGQQPGDQTR